MFVENPTSSPDSDPNLSINEHAILRKFLDTVNIDSDDDLSSACSNCKRPPEKREELKWCLRCHITRFCSVQCQRKDWDFHRFACSVAAKRSDTVKA